MPSVKLHDCHHRTTTPAVPTSIPDQDASQPLPFPIRKSTDTYMMAVAKDWKSIASAKRNSCYEKIPKEWRLPASILADVNETSTQAVTHIPRKCGILSPEEIDITENYDATDLLKKLASSEFSATSVARAFCKRAAIAQQLTHCLTETFFDEALVRAKFLDEYLATEKKPFGPLHGLPISVKDSFHYIGQETTLGYVSFVGRPVATTNSSLLRLLLDLGAILYVKTNIPQTLMTADSENNVFGRTLNPHNLSLTAGGSSGGEGALVGIRGALIGVGTDIGGSIRVPALCCGTYGLRPSANRVPYGGQSIPGRLGSPGVLAAAGPLTTSFRDMCLFMETVISKLPWNYDHSAAHIPWKNVQKKDVLTIGVLPADPAFPLHPPVQRALDSALQKLKAAGHILMELEKVPSIAIANAQIIELYSLDPAITPFKNIEASGEPKIRSVAESPFVSKRNGTLTLDNLYDLNATKAQCLRDWHSIWIEKGLDVIVGPVAETTAMPHDTFGNTPYTTLWNYLDYPAVVIPYLLADKSIDTGAGFSSYKPYVAEATDGAPVAIQVAARPLFDEELLEAADTISKVLNA